MADPLLNNVTLSANFVDNSAEIDVKNCGALSLFVDYTKGDEQHAHLLMSFSSIKDDAGAEIWFDWSDINQVNGVDNHLIESDPFKFADTGKYRIPPIALNRREDKVRIQVRAESPGAGPGTMSVYYVKDKEVE